jgi:hypothetical protein
MARTKNRNNWPQKSARITKEAANKPQSMCSSWLAIALAKAAAFFRGNAFSAPIWPGCVNFTQQSASFFIFEGVTDRD